MNEPVEYPAVELSREETPPRSALYALTQTANGSVLAEGITSYAMNLAEAHNLPLGVLVSRVLGPKIMFGRTDRLRTGELLRQASASIGIGREARAWATAVSAMTGLDSTRMTLLPWAGVLPPTHVVGEFVRHCPRCLQDVSHSRTYEPLIWGLELVTACPVHECLLEERCPSCGRNQPPLRYRSLAGLCRSCGAWLGAIRPQRTASPRELWTSKAIAELVARPPEVEPSPEALQAVLGVAIRNLGPTQEAFAHAIGAPTSGVSYWRRGKTHPSLDALLRICSLGGWSLRDFLVGRIQEIGPGLEGRDRIESPWRGRRPLGWRAIRRQFERILDGASEPPSLTAVAQILRLDRKALRANLPDLCAIATSTRSSWLAARSDRRRIEAIAMVVAITTDLHTNGMKPSRRRVESRLEHPFTLRELDLKSAWIDTVRALRAST